MNHYLDYCHNHLIRQEFLRPLFDYDHSMLHWLSHRQLSTVKTHLLKNYCYQLMLMPSVVYFLVLEVDHDVILLAHFETKPEFKKNKQTIIHNTEMNNRILSNNLKYTFAQLSFLG